MTQLPGLFNHSLVGQLFLDYNRPWEKLAREHIKTVWSITQNFLSLVVAYLTDDHTGSLLQNLQLSSSMSTKLVVANSKLDELLEVHKEAPLTVNPGFVNKVHSIREAANRADWAYGERLRSGYEGLRAMEDFSMDDYYESIRSITADHDKDMVAAKEALVVMQAYYEVRCVLFLPFPSI